MSWKSHIGELRARERLAEQMGGEERVARQRASGKLTVRERIAFLADPGSFHEVGKIAGKAEYGPDEAIAEFLPATMVFGRATLDGRPAVLLGDDFTRMRVRVDPVERVFQRVISDDRQNGSEDFLLHQHAVLGRIEHNHGRQDELRAV